DILQNTENAEITHDLVLTTYKIKIKLTIPSFKQELKQTILTGLGYTIS
ncbi:MAG: hypothetical protein RJA81_768, partial [Planctomycetota bacterium]